MERMTVGSEKNVRGMQKNHRMELDVQNDC